MNLEDEKKLEREIADDYRRQRQLAEGEKNSFQTMGRENFLRWLADNEARLVEIARANGSIGDAARAAVDEYRQQVAAAPCRGIYDDPNAYLILERAVREIEVACTDAGLPLRSGVAVGPIPKLGLEIGQLPVLTTEAGIIVASVPFLPFCNMMSKVLATSLPHTFEAGRWKIDHDPRSVTDRITRNPLILQQWARLFASYALFGWPPEGNAVEAPSSERIVTRILLLRAIERFAIGHEYGHHWLAHEGTTTAADDIYELEHQADLFARLVSMSIGLKEEPPNVYSIFGIGGVVILRAIDIVQRAKAVLLGTDVVQQGASHPPVSQRLERIKELDSHAPPEYQSLMEIHRNDFLIIFDNLWVALEPVFQDLHAQGIRPIESVTMDKGWLPLSA